MRKEVPLVKLVALKARLIWFAGFVRAQAKNVCLVIVGSLILAFGLNYFTIANHLAEGGFTGIALLLNYATGVSPGLAYFVLNVPLFLVGWRMLGTKSMVYTVLGVSSVSLFLKLTEQFQQPLQGDLLLAALYAGVMSGSGLGIILRYGGTSGGTDIIARIFERKYGLSVGRTLFLFDVLVILASIPVIGRERALYTMVAVFIAGRIIDYVQEASYGAKAAMIISDHASEITEAIHVEMGRGTTYLQALGGYTGAKRNAIYCVVARHEIAPLKEIVYRFDDDPFLVISDVQDVVGEGFTYPSPVSDVPDEPDPQG
jgi:uncharacterized membrane-anchored protein YitT (DUF2179 family)